MTLPFENDTRRIIHGLAKADLKTHKLKTFLTAIIIILATCLMATIFSVLVNDALDQANQAPYHAMYRAVNEDTKTTLQSDKDFEAVGIYKSFGNQVDRDGRTDLAYMDEQALAFMGFRLVDGVIPDSENEVLVSETYLKNRALSMGDIISLRSPSLAIKNRQKINTPCLWTKLRRPQSGGYLIYSSVACLPMR